MDHSLQDSRGVHYRLNYLSWADGPESNAKHIFGDSINFGGNIECTPPITAGGKIWPHGRIVVGTASEPGIHRSNLVRHNIERDLLEFLKAQEIQLQIEIPIAWTDLRHIDEIFCFVPKINTTNPSDFSVFLASPARADAIMQSLELNTPMEYVTASTESKLMSKRFTSVAGYLEGTGGLELHDMKTVEYITATGEMIGATKLREANQKLLAQVSSLRALLKQELGLSDEDIVELPQLFTMGGGDCKAAPCHAAVANIQILGNKALTFSCYGPRVGGQDAFNNELKQALQTHGYVAVKMQVPANWFVQNGGGVHCASNKIPDLNQINTQWWK